MKHVMILAVIVAGMFAVVFWEGGVREASAASCPTYCGSCPTPYYAMGYNLGRLGTSCIWGAGGLPILRCTPGGLGPKWNVNGAYWHPGGVASCPQCGAIGYFRYNILANQGGVEDNPYILVCMMTIDL